MAGITVWTWPKPSFRVLLSVSRLLMRGQSALLLLIRRSTSAVTSCRGRGWINCCRLALHACALGGPGTVHAVVAQEVIPVQAQVREPRAHLQCGPAFRCKVVPHTVVVELNLRQVADCIAHGQVEGCREDVGAEKAWLKTKEGGPLWSRVYQTTAGLNTRPVRSTIPLSWSAVAGPEPQARRNAQIW